MTVASMSTMRRSKRVDINRDVSMFSFPISFPSDGRDSRTIEFEDGFRFECQNGCFLDDDCVCVLRSGRDNTKWSPARTILWSLSSESAETVISPRLRCVAFLLGNAI